MGNDTEATGCGAPSLVITVVPDTGTEEIAGLAGTKAIIIEAGRHRYDFDYTIRGSA